VSAEHPLKQLLSERGWIFAAGACLILAAIFLARDNMNAAFVAATLGLVAWFLNVRNQLKRNIIPADDEVDDESDARINDEDESDEIEDVDES
jgi:flagellar biosynthesis component FlhA